MIWILYALPGLAVVYLAARFSRFNRYAERILSVVAALGLLISFGIWFADGNKAAEALAPETAAPEISASDIALGNLTYTSSRPETSYRVAGTILNRSRLNLDYFRLTVRLENCPQGVCRTVGSDTALILARLTPEKSMPFETFFTIPNPAQIDISAPQWSYAISDVKARSLPQ